MAGIEELNRTINRFEEASKTLREESRLAHEAAQAAKEQRRLLEKAMADAIENCDQIIADHVQKELKQIGEQAEKAAHHTYDKVGNQIDLLIGIALGKKLSRRKNVEDLRPAIAAKLREWIQEEIEKATQTGEEEDVKNED